MEREVEVEQEKSNGLMEKTNRLEIEVLDERKTRSVLEGNVDRLKQSTNTSANWTVAGVRCISFSLFLYSPIINASLKTVVNLSDEFRSVIFGIAFKQS